MRTKKKVILLARFILRMNLSSDCDHYSILEDLDYLLLILKVLELPAVSVELVERLGEGNALDLVTMLVDYSIRFVEVDTYYDKLMLVNSIGLYGVDWLDFDDNAPRFLLNVVLLAAADHDPITIYVNWIWLIYFSLYEYQGVDLRSDTNYRNIRVRFLRYLQRLMSLDRFRNIGL